MLSLRPWVAAVLLLASPAAATTVTTLSVDSGQSFLIAGSGPIEALAGTITLEIGALPVGPGNTTFDVIGLDVTTTSGSTIVLDPLQSSPGLGVLSPAGGFLIPTLYLRLSDGVTTADLALPDVTGSVVFGPGGAGVAELSSGFTVLGPSGPIDVSFVAFVPEPASALLAGFGLAVLAARARRSAWEASR